MTDQDELPEWHHRVSELNGRDEKIRSRLASKWRVDSYGKRLRKSSAKIFWDFMLIKQSFRRKRNKFRYYLDESYFPKQGTLT